MIHHIIPKHEWKKRFGNLKGVNSIDNLIELTVQQHAQVHALLYEINGEEYDRIASITLSGLIGQEEAMKLTSSCTMMGNKHCLGKKNSLGYRHTEEFKRKQAERQRGRKHPHTEEHKRMISQIHTGKKRGPYKRKSK